MAQRGGPLKPLGMVATQCQAMPARGNPLRLAPCPPVRAAQPLRLRTGPVLLLLLAFHPRVGEEQLLRRKGANPIRDPLFFYPIFFHRKKKGPLVKLHKKKFFF